jgi:FkbH-like protein
MPADPEPLLAVSATFTAEPLAETLAFWLKELDLRYQVRFAPYNQVFQQLLDPSSLLAGNRHGINVLLLRFEDWLRFKPAAPPAELEADLCQLIALIESAGRISATPLIVAICPASPGLAAHAARRIEALAAERLAGLPSVHLITPSAVDELYPVADPHDPHADELGHVPYVPEYFAALGTILARRIHALRVAPYKVIALDCDDTLWNGICGEDGPEGVVLDEPRRALQEFMLAQRSAGMLLCLATKNNPEDVEETFRVHPDMPLRLEHFTATRINWEPKPRNLAALADELELGLDSFIFIDDNIKESSEVQANCPEVLSLTLPPDPADIPRFLLHVWAFDHLRITEEDRQRNELYAQRIERGRAEKQAASLSEFLASLHLEVRIAPMTEDQLPRVSQLTYRTNQMNFSTLRRSEGEIRELIDSGAAECLTVHVADRFGSYGLTGVIIHAVTGDALAIDTFLLSCRALGRGVEHRMLARLGEIALERGCPFLEARYRRTQRNAPALLFLESIAARLPQADGLLFRIPAPAAAALAYVPNGTRRPAPAEPGPTRIDRKTVDYERIAEELSDPARLLAHMRAARRPRPSNGAAAAPRTDLEARLARIWADTLGVDSLGIHDNFFDLGGHSLLAVELLARVRKELGIELSLEVVYSGDFTVAELAKAIELKELERAGAGDYQALLAELDRLSDEEVRALLAQEGQEADS